MIGIQTLPIIGHSHSHWEIHHADNHTQIISIPQKQRLSPLNLTTRKDGAQVSIPACARNQLTWQPKTLIIGYWCIFRHGIANYLCGLFLCVRVSNYWLYRWVPIAYSSWLSILLTLWQVSEGTSLRAFSENTHPQLRRNANLVHEWEEEENLTTCSEWQMHVWNVSFQSGPSPFLSTWVGLPRYIACRYVMT